MWIIAKESSNIEFKQIPTGSYPARCVRLVDLGTHKSEYMGKEIEKHEIMIGFEFPTELEIFDEGKWEQPFFSSKYFTLSLSEKANLRKFLENWRWKTFTSEELAWFDLTNLIWVEAMISIIEVTNKDWQKRNVIGSATRLPKGMECPPQINESIVFSLDWIDFDENILNKLWNKTVEKIKQSKEYQNLNFWM
jgi:hypothetical protein